MVLLFKGGVEWEEEEEDEEALLVVASLVKSVVEGVGVSATFCFCAVLQGTNIPFADTCFLLLRDAKVTWNGRIGMGNIKIGGPQTKRDKIRIGCLTLPSGGPQVGGNATLPLHSRGPPTKGTTSKHKKKTKEKFLHFVPNCT